MQKSQGGGDLPIPKLKGAQSQQGQWNGARKPRRQGARLARGAGGARELWAVVLAKGWGRGT